MLQLAERVILEKHKIDVGVVVAATNQKQWKIIKTLLESKMIFRAEMRNLMEGIQNKKKYNVISWRLHSTDFFYFFGLKRQNKKIKWKKSRKMMKMKVKKKTKINGWFEKGKKKGLLAPLLCCLFYSENWLGTSTFSIISRSLFFS